MNRRYQDKTIDITVEKDFNHHAFTVSEGQLLITGNLIHNSRFQPRTAADAERLISFLQDWIERQHLEQERKRWATS